MSILKHTMNTMNTMNILSINLAGSQCSILEFYQNIGSPRTIFDHQLSIANEKCKQLLIEKNFLSVEENGSILPNKNLYEILSSIDQLYPDPNINRYNPGFNPNTNLDEINPCVSIFNFEPLQDINFDTNTFSGQWNYAYSLLSEEFIQKILQKLAKKNILTDVSNEDAKKTLREVLFSYDTIVRDAFIHSQNQVKEMFPDMKDECSIEKLHAQFQEHKDKTVNYVLEYIERNNIDIVFLQELNIPMFEELNISCSKENSNYNLVMTTVSEMHPMSAFLVKKTHNFTVVNPDIENTSEVMNETVVIEIEGVVFINTHLSSKNRKKTEGHPKNHEDQLDVLLNWCRTRTKWILGGDLNHHPETIENVVLYPSGNVPTTRKMRTWLQAQPGKAGILAESCCDHFCLSGCEFDIENPPRICMVGKPEFDHVHCDDISLPNLFSIGDHFSVRASIIM